MSGVATLHAADVAKAEVAGTGFEGTDVEQKMGRGSIDVTAYSDTDDSAITGDISKDDLKNLRRISGEMPWSAFTIAFVELCERFSYYGTTVVFVNFIQRPLPAGYPSGAGHAGQSGALGMGQRASTGLTTFNQFWAYLMPLFGAYLADAHLGRLKTIFLAIGIAIIGHVVLTVSAIPAVIAKPDASIGIFAVGLIIFGVGTGCFKSNISPLLAEQVKDIKMRITTTKTGERVLIDPAITTSRLFLYFYMCINVGSLVGQIAMVFAETYVGFWLAFVLPTGMFFIAPIVLGVNKKNYRLTPPTGSVMKKFFQMMGLALKGRWSLNLVKMSRNFDWDVVRPSKVPAERRPSWMTYDDAWVDEVRRGLKACKVFTFMPLYWLAYGQMTNNLTSQAATMQLNGVPNDIIQNLNPISIVIMIPIMDFVVYPALRKARIQFTPLKRIFCGFILASLSMVCACVIQYYIYKMSPCGDQANSCDDPAPINVWIQTIPYVLIGVSEIFTSITGLEYAFSKAPTNMRSLVMAINLFTNAISSALAQALVSLSDDPLLVWNYGVVAVLSLIGGIAFWYCFAQLDRDEDKWNMLQTSAYRGKNVGDVSEEANVTSNTTSIEKRDY